MNAGVYVFNHAVLQHIPEEPASLERDVFPQLLDQGVYALEQHGMFIDIGTPADYARAQQLCDLLNEAALEAELPAHSITESIRAEQSHRGRVNERHR